MLIKNWLEKVDPYYTQRLILHKALYIATLLAVVNWFATPDVFTAYALPAILLGGVYDSPSLTSIAEKKLVFIVTYLISAIASVTFYLLYSFKFTLMFFAIGYFSFFYLLSEKYLPKFKPFVLLTIVVAAFNMALLPAGSIQIAIDMFSCFMMSMVAMYVGLRTFPHKYYIQVWRRAFVLYIGVIYEEIGHAINKFDSDTFRNGATHLNTLRSYRRLIPRNMMYNSFRAIVAIRDIQFVLNHLFILDKDEEFWQSIREHLQLYKIAIINTRACELYLSIKNIEQDYSENYVVKKLNKSIKNWNQLCDLI